MAAGAHVALFRLLVDNHTANNAPIVTLDVVDADRGQRLAARTLTRQEFSAAYTYEFFALPFTSAAGAQLEFRTWWHDTSFVQLDEVAVLDAPVPQRLIDQVLVQAEQITMKERAILKDIDGGIAMPALARALFGRGG